MAVYDWNTIEPESVTDLYQRKIAQGHQLSVARLEVGKGSITRAHRHPHEEVIVLLQGRWLFRFTDREVVLEPNQILTIAPGLEHSSETLEDVVAIDVCTPTRDDWNNGDDRGLHEDPDRWLWAV